MSTVEYHPVILDDVAIEQYTKISFTEIATLGASLASVAHILKDHASHAGQATGGATEKLYRMENITLGGWEKFQNAKNGGINGNVVDIRTGDITQRARFSEVKQASPSAPTLQIDPAVMMMAVALATVNKRLDGIEAAQRDIIEFLQAKEKAALKGNLAVLQEILEEYKFNWDNDKYKNNKHIQVQEIKRDAEKSIMLCRDLIEKKAKKAGFLHIDRDVRAKLDKLMQEFKDYELAIYLFSFSSFLEIMLLENFDSGYLDSVVQRISLYLEQYKGLFDACRQQLEGDSKSSVQSYVLKGVAGINRAMGSVISKIPKIKDGQADEALIASGNKVDSYNDSRAATILKDFCMSSQGLLDKILPFIDNINSINALYNKEPELLFTEDAIYVAVA